jgi:hypothetical protein
MGFSPERWGSLEDIALYQRISKLTNGTVLLMHIFLFTNIYKKRSEQINPFLLKGIVAREFLTVIRSWKTNNFFIIFLF